MVKKITTEEKKKSSFRNKKEKDVVYTALQECFVIETDTAWKEIFNNMSRGICPKGIMIQNGTIVGSISKKNSVKYSFLNQDPKDIIYNIKNLYSNLLDIQSDNNKRNKEYDDINDLYNDFINMEWKSIKKKALKDLLIQNYVIDLKHKYNLKSNVSKCGLDTICNALYLHKTHKNIDIEYSNGKITNIKDIVVENSAIINKRIEKIISINYESDVEEEEEQEDEDKDTIVSFKKLWESYLQTINKG
jgi:hypothetical protein